MQNQQAQAGREADPLPSPDELRFFVASLIIGVTLHGGIVFYYQTGKLSGFVAVNLLQLYIGLCVLAGVVLFRNNLVRYGLNRNRLKFNLLTGLGIGLTGMAVALYARQFLAKNGHPDFAIQWHPELFFRRLALYPINAFSQEALSKGFYQCILISLFKDSRAGKWKALLLVALLFGQFHIFYGLEVSLGCALFAYLTGIYYEKTRSLIGVYIIHLLSGFGLLFFSGTF